MISFRSLEEYDQLQLNITSWKVLISGTLDEDIAGMCEKEGKSLKFFLILEINFSKGLWSFRILLQ